MCSTSASEHLETLSSAARVAKVSGEWRVAAVAEDPVGLSLAGSEAEPGAADEAFAFFFAFLAAAGDAGGDTAGGMSEPASRPATKEGEGERDIFFSEDAEKPAESPPKGKKTSRKKERAR